MAIMTAASVTDHGHAEPGWLVGSMEAGECGGQGGEEGASFHQGAKNVGSAPKHASAIPIDTQAKTSSGQHPIGCIIML
jgi:hypothetical protein